MKICGIYKISNKINNKCYIGLSNNIQKRWKYHKADLMGNKHNNSYLQNVYNVDNNCLEYSIIHTCQENDLGMYEKYFIKKLKSFYKDGGYNMTLGGETLGSGENHPCYGKPPWNKGKKTLLIPWNKGLIHPNPYGCYNEKRIKQFDKQGNFIKEWNSVTEASRYLNIGRTSIDQCLRNKSKSAGNFIWQCV